MAANPQGLAFQHVQPVQSVQHDSRRRWGQQSRLCNTRCSMQLQAGTLSFKGGGLLQRCMHQRGRACIIY